MAQKFDPRDLLNRYEWIRDSVSLEDLFNRPAHAKTREFWIAGHLGLGYSECVKPCSVWIDDGDEQHDFDFELEVDGKRFPFQATEVQEPGRRRGLEYRNKTRLFSTIEDWSPGTEEGPEWVKGAIEKKLKKCYSTLGNLNLVVYLNYPAYEQNYEVLKSVCSDQAREFASTWLITGDSVCCIAENPALGSFDGWCVFTKYKHLGMKE